MSTSPLGGLSSRSGSLTRAFPYWHLAQCRSLRKLSQENLKHLPPRGVSKIDAVSSESSSGIVPSWSLSPSSPGGISSPLPARSSLRVAPWTAFSGRLSPVEVLPSAPALAARSVASLSSSWVSAGTCGSAVEGAAHPLCSSPDSPPCPSPDQGELIVCPTPLSLPWRSVAKFRLVVRSDGPLFFPRLNSFQPWRSTLLLHQTVTILLRRGRVLARPRLGE